MKKRNIIPLLLIFCPYIFLLMIFLSDENNFDSLLVTYLLFTTVIYILNIINACKINEENDFYTLAFWNMTIKLIHIPFFVTMFIVGMIFIMAMVVPALLLASPIICLILACMNYILIMVSSSYGIKAVLKMKKENILSNKEATIHIIMHLIFILDVISSIIIFNKARKENKKR